MAVEFRKQFVQLLQGRYGSIGQLPDSHSLFVIGEDAARIYYRFSRVHSDGRTFFGLRNRDLQQLAGHNSFICFMLDDQSEPVLMPFADLEDILSTATPANDGQYKVQIVKQEGARSLYIPRKGKFALEGFVGLNMLEQSLEGHTLHDRIELSHSQVQTLLGGVGHMKGHDVWIPDSNVGTLDWTVTSRFPLARRLPSGFDEIEPILGEIDVVWVARGSSRIEGLFEVEHSTPIYSGLLRFNDVLLTSPSLSCFHIVSNDARRSTFTRQIGRPTFRKSGLAEVVRFIRYENVFDWHSRLLKGNCE